MADKKKKASNLLTEQLVRNEDLFCSLLLDEGNSTLRVVDFRGGNFQQKHNYLKRIQLAEGFRKIFTLIERDDMQGWQRCGYVKEGSIPGYYRRSDAYLMGWIADDGWRPEELEEESEERKVYIQSIRDLADDYEGYKSTGFTSESLTVEEVPEILRREMDRQKTANSKRKGVAREQKVFSPTEHEPLFPQFSRGVEHYYLCTTNRRSRQSNLLAAEYQDCFGNAKLNVFFDTIRGKGDVGLLRSGIDAFVKWLGEMGAVAIFSLVDMDNTQLNAVFASCGFKNTGWLNEQVVRGSTVADQILWTLKLAI